MKCIARNHLRRKTTNTHTQNTPPKPKQNQQPGALQLFALPAAYGPALQFFYVAVVKALSKRIEIQVVLINTLRLVPCQQTGFGSHRVVKPAEHLVQTHRCQRGSARVLARAQELVELFLGLEGQQIPSDHVTQSPVQPSCPRSELTTSCCVEAHLPKRSSVKL